MDKDKVFTKDIKLYCLILPTVRIWWFCPYNLFALIYINANTVTTKLHDNENNVLVLIATDFYIGK